MSDNNESTSSTPLQLMTVLRGETTTTLISTVSVHSIQLECLIPSHEIVVCSFHSRPYTGSWAKSGQWVLLLKWALLHNTMAPRCSQQIWPLTNSHSHGAVLLMCQC